MLGSGWPEATAPAPATPPPPWRTQVEHEGHLLLLAQPFAQLHGAQVGGVRQEVEAVARGGGGQARHQHHVGAGHAARQHLAVLMALLAQAQQPAARAAAGGGLV